MKILCPTCKKPISRQEASVIKQFGFKECVVCRIKKQQKVVRAQ